MSSVLYKNRYCDQEDFDLIVSSELTDDFDNNEAVVNKINYPEFTKGEKVYSKSTFSEDDKILPYKSSVLAISGKQIVYCDVDDFRNSFDGSLPREVVVFIPEEKTYYCACLFMKNLYIIGGETQQSNNIMRNSSCLKYDIKSSQWSCIAEMKIHRICSACTVFEGKIVISGGYSNLKSVEAYDYYENKWSYLPDMIQGKYSHGSVGLCNKIFIIGNVFDTSEVFDSNSRVFTEIKNINNKSYSLRRTALVGIGYKIIVFGTMYRDQYKSKDEMLFIYDIFSDQWTEKENYLTNKVTTCTKVPVV